MICRSLSVRRRIDSSDSLPVRCRGFWCRFLRRQLFGQHIWNLLVSCSRFLLRRTNQRTRRNNQRWTFFLIIPCRVWGWSWDLSCRRCSRSRGSSRECWRDEPSQQLSHSWNQLFQKINLWSNKIGWIYFIILKLYLHIFLPIIPNSLQLPAYQLQYLLVLDQLRVLQYPHPLLILHLFYLLPTQHIREPLHQL